MRLVDTSASTKARPFLSYSRNDSAFLQRLTTALERLGYSPIFDQSKTKHDDPDLNLNAQDEWWLALKAMIAASDMMVFVVSPSSAASAVCDDEIAYAKGLGKRIIAILRAPIDFDRAPQRLRMLNVAIDFTSDAETSFDLALKELCNEIDLDVDWHRQVSRLARLADQWHKEGKPEALLLRSGAIEDADRRMSRRPLNAPAEGELFHEFINASREFERAQSRRQRRIAGRAFVRPSEQLLNQTKHEAALRHAAAGAILADDITMQLVPELARPMRQALMERRSLNVFRGELSTLVAAALSPDSTKVATAHFNGEAIVWDILSGAPKVRLNGHSGPLTHVSFSPDGSLVATSSRDRTASLWNTTSGDRIAHIVGHSDIIRSLEFDQSGQRVVTASYDNTAGIWNARDGSAVALLRGHSKAVLSARFSPDGSRILTAGGDSAVALWDSHSGKTLQILEGHKRVVFDARYSANGSRIISASADETAIVWDGIKGRLVSRFSGHSGHVWCADLSHDSSCAVSGSDDHTARIWEPETGKELARLQGHEHFVRSVKFDAAATRVITASADKTARIWDVATGEQILVVGSHAGQLVDARFSSDGTAVLTTSSGDAAYLWDAASSLECTRLVGHSDEVVDVAFLGGNDVVATASRDRTVRIWDLTGGRQVQLLQHDLPLTRIVVDQARGMMAVLSDQAWPSIWKLGQSATNGWQHALNINMDQHTGRSTTLVLDRTARAMAVFSAHGRTEIWRVGASSDKGSDQHLVMDTEQRVWDAVFSPNGKLLLTGTEGGEAEVWDTSTGKKARRFWMNWGGGSEGPAHGEAIVDVAFDPAGILAVTASRDQFAIVWNVATGEIVATLRGHEGVVRHCSFSPNGSQILTASSDKTARVWDAASGRLIATLDGHFGSIWAAEFDPSGCVVATASDDQTMRLWRQVDIDGEIFWELSGVLKGHCGAIVSVSFSADSARLVSASTDGTACVWDVMTGAQIAKLAGHRGPIRNAIFSPDGSKVVTVSADQTARVWDVSRTSASSLANDICLGVGLSHGVGFRDQMEQDDLLMQDAPLDMYDAVTKHLNEEQMRRIQMAGNALRRPLDFACYLSPHQMDERFGVAVPWKPGDQDEIGDAVSSEDGEDGKGAAEQGLAAGAAAAVTKPKLKWWWPFG